MIAAQIAVQKKSSIVRWLEIASMSSSMAALMMIENSPSVTIISGSVSNRSSVPRTALTIPNSAAIQRYAQNPPDTFIPERSQLVIANANARTTQRMSSVSSTASEYKQVTSLISLSALATAEALAGVGALERRG